MCRLCLCVHFLFLFYSITHSPPTCTQTHMRAHALTHTHMYIYIHMCTHSPHTIYTDTYMYTLNTYTHIHSTTQVQLTADQPGPQVRQVDQMEYITLFLI